MDIEEEEPEEDPAEEPEPLAGHEDQFDARPNPQPGNINGWVDDDDDDVELEAEEPDGVPEAVIGAGSQRPFAIRDFPIGVYKTGESSTTRDPQFVGGLAPWALRRDLEALRRHERIREAEAETSGSGGTGGNADGTGVRGTGPTVPKLTRCTYATFIKCDPLPFIGTEGAVGLC
uniref:Reverse transcriptase domain-containing protein n=1 Tax=Tanacetum cinerariifolium TaxID=118510 RepID=A0A699T7X1_TANCI|nr:hypothetical protein [Tanacetum cinerariifolium]